MTGRAATTMARLLPGNVPECGRLQGCWTSFAWWVSASPDAAFFARLRPRRCCVSFLGDMFHAFVCACYFRQQHKHKHLDRLALYSPSLIIFSLHFSAWGTFLGLNCSLASSCAHDKRTKDRFKRNEIALQTDSQASRKAERHAFYFALFSNRFQNLFLGCL